jgi:hypothetical protein
MANLSDWNGMSPPHHMTLRQEQTDLAHNLPGRVGAHLT